MGHAGAYESSYGCNKQARNDDAPRPQSINGTLLHSAPLQFA